MQWLLQTLLLACAFLLALWVRLPAVALVGLVLTAAALISPALAPRFVRGWIDGAALAAFWIGSLTVWVAMARENFAWDFYYVVPAELMAAAVWLSAWRAASPSWKGRWNAAVMAWLLCGAFMWLGAGYFQNQRGVFFPGLFAMLAVLALCRLWFVLGAFGAQMVNTLILLLVGLPLVDLALRPQSRVAVRPETCRLYYSYDAAKGDPEAFARWEEYYTSQFDRLGTEIFEPAPNSVYPFRLRPGSHGTMVNCPISINSLGFRGPEFSAAKDGAYRIVALGESTTFGMTIQPDDKPWPEVLEQIIRQRLKTRRPVQVINAGVPAYSIVTSVYRLPGEILPLQPDMIISYHGANGFNLVEPFHAAGSGAGPARLSGTSHQTRGRCRASLAHVALPISCQATRRFRLRRRPCSRWRPNTPPAYRQLIQCARTNGIRLALANFSMAVNQASDPKVIDFYRGGGARAALGFIRANAAHSIIVSNWRRNIRKSASSIRILILTANTKNSST